MVIAIERNHWPKEWRCLIRLEVLGKSPRLRTAILDRGTLNPLESCHYIRPEVATLKDDDVAFFFNAFERPLKVTIIQSGNPGFHETVRMVQPLQQEQSPIMKLQEIESHRLFTAEMWSLYTDNSSEERALEPTSNSTIKWGPKIDWDPPLDIGKDIIMNQDPLLEGSPLHTANWHPDNPKSGVVEIQTRSDTMDRVGGKRKLPPGEGGTVVLLKKKRCRGKLVGLQKILIKWSTITIPCAFSALLTPATVITDIGISAMAPRAALLKATLNSPNNLLAALQRDTPLSEQGIQAGDTLTLLVRHATIFDPYGNQHSVAYREDETIWHLLATLRDVSPIPPLSKIILCHNEFQLGHASRFQDCNLPHEPTLHARLSNQAGPDPRIQPARSNLDADGLPEGQGNKPSGVVREETVQQGQKEGDTAADGQKTGLFCSQVFLQDLEGKTHTLTFNPLESIAKNLLKHSSQLKLAPLRELYLLLGRYVLKIEEALDENGLLQEPHLRFMLRCRGGMKGNPKSPSQGAPGAKGRGTRSPGGEGTQMGGSHGSEVTIHHTPPLRGGRGRGHGSRAAEHKRPTLVHSGTQRLWTTMNVVPPLKQSRKHTAL